MESQITQNPFFLDITLAMKDHHYARYLGCDNTGRNR